MRNLIQTLLLMLLFISAPLVRAQSLAEAARKEADRRRSLEEQGVQAKVIDNAGVARVSNGNITTSIVRPSESKAVLHPSPKRSPGSIRTTLTRIDREIWETAEKLKSVRARADAMRWASPKTGRITRHRAREPAEERLQSEIANLELKLERLRKERFDAYAAGLKAGFLPGELDGKGITP